MARKTVPPYPRFVSLCARRTVRARDYLNGYGPFGRYNFFNISAPIGTGRRPLKDHPPTKVGRLPRRHRKTPSSGSGAASVISRKPHHFACIIHSNSPVLPAPSLAAQRRISHRDRKEATWRERSFRSLVLFCTRNGLSYCQRRHWNVPGPRLFSLAFAKHCWWYISGYSISFHIDARFNLLILCWRSPKNRDLCSCRYVIPSLKYRRLSSIDYLYSNQFLKNKPRTCTAS